MVIIPVSVVLASLLHSSLSEPLKFLAIGDWGDNDGNQYQVARAMAAWAETRQPIFILTLGDNFYPSGVESTEDVKWDINWQMPYMSYESLHVPWMVSVGNHDWDAGTVQPQIDYTLLDPYWTFPTRYFTFNKTAGDATVEFIALDTDVLADDPDQLDWINQTLRESTADWIIPFGHHPVYSTGKHGRWLEVAWNDQNLKPLFIEHNVAFFLCGHDHDQQHITDDSPVDYIVSGGGHESRDINLWAYWQTARRGATVQWRRSSLGFIDVEIEDNQATIIFVNELGEQIYTLTKTNPRSVV